MNQTLQELVLDRLQRAPPEISAAEDLILAACLGEAEFEQALGGNAQNRAAIESTRLQTPHSGVWLEQVDVAGFRGIGPKATLSLTPRPGLTLVIGRNGSGKSSFAEAVEFLLTGRNYRWEAKSRIWSQGWRNLHQAQSAVSARFSQDGVREPTLIESSWGPDAALLDADRRVQKPAGTNLEQLGWSEALESFRPFLSYNELGSLLDEGPTKLYDALASILGLQDLTVVQHRLSEARLTRVNLYKSVSEALSPLIEQLASIDDLRARTCLKALNGRKWDLDVVELALRGTVDSGDVEGEMALLRQLATLPPPDGERVAQVAAGLRAAADAAARVSGTDSGQAKRTIKLLKDALVFHKHAGDSDCPVCQRPNALSDAWRQAAQAQIEVLSMAASEAEEAEQRQKAAYGAARGLLTMAPGALQKAATVGLDSRDVARAWTAYLGVPPDDDLKIVADHLETSADQLAAKLKLFSGAAQEELDRREDAWRPIAHELEVWLAQARQAVEQQAPVPVLKAAEKWIKEATGALRDERFAPIADKVSANWRMLRQNSSVSLGPMRLDGTGSKRRLALDIDIDGKQSEALAVMSQGEINCLALSLFLPRATLEESPFRFVLIDDPVQSMDPAKVEGLARVLGEVSESRQVIVLTHDDRLPQAVWRLDIPATVLEVSRGEQSAVEVRRVKDPVQRYLEDARAIAADQNLPLQARRVVPGFCRQALEEACALSLWRRRLAAGMAHDRVETELGGVTTVTMWMALALFDDAQRGGDVMATLNNRHGGWAGDTFSRLKKGPHEGDSGDLKQLIRDTERLTDYYVAHR